MTNTMPSTKTAPTLVVLAMMTFTAAAQEPAGVVQYQHTYPLLYHPSIDLQKEVSEAACREVPELPTHTTLPRTLVFDSFTSLMKPTSKVAVEPGRRVATEGMEHIDTTVVSFASNDFVESRAFQGDLFLVKDEMPGTRWNVTNEERMYLGHRVMKATAETDAGPIEAWFAPGIPFPAGPGLYGGLPGLILMVNNAQYGEVYAADSLAIGPSVPPAVSPMSGRKVSESEYGQIRAETLTEEQQWWGELISDIREGRTKVNRSRECAAKLKNRRSRKEENQ